MNNSVSNLTKLNTIIRVHKTSLDKYLKILDDYMSGKINREELSKKMEGKNMSKFVISEDEKDEFFDWLLGEETPVIKEPETKEDKKIESKRDANKEFSEAAEDHQTFHVIPERIAKMRAEKQKVEILEEW